jgi:capsular polysaccharide transport system permease protein
MVSSRGLSQAHDETYIVDEFITSRDALAWLLKNEHIRDAFTRNQADFLNRYPPIFGRDSEENLFRYYQKMVSSEVNESTGLSTISVVAFTPEDAQRVAAALLRAAEALINRLNERSEADAVNIAERAVAEAHREMDDVEERLKDYRSKAGFVDAARENTSEMQTVTRLSTEIAQMRAELQREIEVTPGSPAIEATRAKIGAYQSELDRRRAQITGGDASIASRTSGYDELVFEKTLAEKAWASAEASRVAARANATRQHLYLQTVVEPNSPDVARYPRRMLYLIITAVAAGMAFSIVRTLRQFAIEHAL